MSSRSGEDVQEQLLPSSSSRGERHVDGAVAVNMSNMPMSAAANAMGSRSFLVILLPRVCYVATLVLVVSWCTTSLGGIRFFTAELVKGGDRDTKKLFNSHPLLMVLAYVVCMSEAILAYKAPISSMLIPLRWQRKLIHAVMHTLAAIFIVMGLYSAFQSHNLAVPPIPNMYSLHSYVGLATAIATLAQYTASVLVFYIPGMSYRVRTFLMPIHLKLGVLVYAAGIATILVGIQEKSTFLQTLGKKYVYGSEIQTGVALGLLSIATAICTNFAVAPMYAAKG